MGTTPRQQEFVSLLTGYMGPAGKEQPLRDFVEKLKFDDARDCTQSFFDLEANYQQARKKYATVFPLLALQCVQKGDAYFALRALILINTAGTPWDRFYRDQPAPAKTSISKSIETAKRGLPAAVKTFIERFDLYMKRRTTQQKVAEYADKESFGPKRLDMARQFLLAYIEISQGYKDGDAAASLLIFYGLSRLAIQRSAPHFAFDYEQRIQQAESIWKKRYTSLETEQQKDIRKDVADRKVIRGDVTIEDRPHKDVPLGKHQIEAPAPEKLQPTDRQIRAELNKLQKQFVALYRKYVDEPKQTTNEIHEFLRTHSGAELQQAVDAYLRDSVQWSKGTHQRSLTVFFAALATAVEKSDAYYAMKVEAEVGTAGSIWAQRFEALKPDQSMRLRQSIDLRKKRPRVIDQVKFAYYARHRRDPDLKELREFEPTSNKEQEDLLSSALSDCDVAVGAFSPELFTKAFTQVSNVLRAQKDTLTLVLLMKRCRERGRLPKHFRLFIYLYSVGVLFAQGMRHVNPKAYNASGFTKEEWQWLLDETPPGSYYYQDFALQLEYAVSGRKTYDLFDVFNSYGVLLIFAERFRLTLTPLTAAATLRGAVEELWRKKPNEIGAIRIKIDSRELKISETVGNFFILWWDPKRFVVYVLVNGFEEVVFEMGTDRLARALYEADTYGAIYEATKHLLVLIPLLFEVLGYIPDLVSGGVTGLFKSVLADQLFDKSFEVLGLDPTTIPIAQLGVGLLQHGTKPSHASKSSPGHVEPDFSALQQKAIREKSAVGVDAAGVDAKAIDTGVIDMAQFRAKQQAEKAAELAKAREALQAQQGRRVAMAGGAGGDGGDYHVGHVDAPTSGHSDVPGRTHTEGATGTRRDPSGKTTGTSHGVPDYSMRFTSANAANANVPMTAPPTLRSDVGHHVGNWTPEGGVWVNRGAMDFRVPPRQNVKEFEALQAKMRDQARNDFRMFENGFNQQLAPRLAQMLTTRPVIRRGVGASRRQKRPPKTASAHLELQGRIKGDPSDRIPDGRLSVYDASPDGSEVLREVHFMEATLETDFVAAAGGKGRKQRQIVGTTRIGEAGKLSGFTPNTKIYYHVMTPHTPTAESTAFLSNLMATHKNLEVRWYVVGAR